LPFRQDPDLEILLVTSRETGRWVIPKGWPVRSKSGESQPCRVTVFALEVVTQRGAWREQTQRSTRWFGWQAAIEAVQEPGLKQIILDFAQGPSAGD
jgi:8-oxo-dGTP pyrophosphatase MutT (NUDIX family)